VENAPSPLSGGGDMDVAVIMQGAERLGEAYGVTMPYAVKHNSAMDGRVVPLSGRGGEQTYSR
ncbi:MAG: hypothetical protein LBD20_08365, partial [Spirochaetaceae bacterium]|nr:hypothetical protein [Spirochaetaceae bacterium]